MAQYIDTRYRARATSDALNKRFGNITGPSVLQGFRIFKGSIDFTISLMSGGYKSNVAITPSGAQVEETNDLINVLQVAPNGSGSGEPRIDSVYLVFEYGVEDKQASYKIIQGTPGNSAENPNKKTHLLLGYVYVYPNNQTLRDVDIISVPLGFSHLNVSGYSTFSGEASFEEDVTFKGNVTFEQGGGSGGSSGPSTLVERMASPVIATEGQTDINLTGDYTPGTKTLFVYRNGKLQPPNRFQEVNARLFRFYDALHEGEEVWAFWYKGLNVYKVPSHNHDSLYFRKQDVIEKLPRFTTDFFAGENGRVITHNLGHTDYIILGITPIERTSDVGEITVEKQENKIIVYNSGTYRGKFDMSYLPKTPGQASGGEAISELTSQFNVESLEYDEEANVYKKVRYRRFDNTLYFEAILSSKDTSGKYTRLLVDYYNQSGTKVIEEQEWALTYDTMGNIKNKTKIQSQ